MGEGLPTICKTTAPRDAPGQRKETTVSRQSDSSVRDEDIIDLYFSRDERAITETERKYGRLCMSVSMGILSDRQDAEECVNDTYLKLWGSMPPLRPLSLVNYILRVVRNLSLNRLRHLTAERRNRDITVSFAELEECIPVRDEYAGDVSRLVSAFLRTEGETDRRLFLGRYWYNLSVSDLAKQWDMTPNAVSLRLRRTRERLRQYLKEGGYTV